MKGSYFMRYLCLMLIQLCLIFSLYSVGDNHQSALAVIIMIKNEAEVITSTLQPFIDAGIDSVLVYDTGSTDGTQTIVHSFFTKNRLDHAYLIEEPFIDFATSRNRLLDLAEEQFPNINLFLMIDAEWYMTGIKDLYTICKERSYYDNEECYAIKLITQADSIDNYAVRLFRRGKNVRYEGVVHETILSPCSLALTDSIYFEYLPKDAGIEKSEKRYVRDYQLLKKSLETDPNNLRTLFYLAQTCQFLNLWKEALYYYQLRADKGKKAEEVSEERYLALYRIACGIQYIICSDNDYNKEFNYKWDDALNYYLQAHQALPHRAEPLLRIANYYLYHKEYAIAYLFAHRAIMLPYPKKDFLFVERNMYDYIGYDIVGQSALYVGQYGEGRQAVLKAIEARPDQKHQYYNLSVYSEILNG
jgi:glycosyltransferase involved in cell wall biosynthesis